MFDPISIGLGYCAWKIGQYIYGELNKSTPSNPQKEAEIKELTAEPIFFAVAILAKFAKSDGIVTKGEIATIEQILRDIDLNGDNRKKAIGIFTKHKNGSLTYEESLGILATLAEEDADFRTGLCFLLLRLAHADGPPPESTLQKVRYACKVLSINFTEAHRTFQQGENERYDTESKDYETLGCSPNDPLEIIKKKYRELTKTFHPDTMSGKDLHPEITKLAVAKFREIQDAYERIISKRNATKPNVGASKTHAPSQPSTDACPKCGKPLGAGVTRCWTRGCDYEIPKKQK